MAIYRIILTVPYLILIAIIYIWSTRLCGE